MFEGRCPKCGNRYYGWALRIPEQQICTECGARLQISVSKGIVSEGYSPSVLNRKLLGEIINILDSKDTEKDRDKKDDQ